MTRAEQIRKAIGDYNASAPTESFYGHPVKKHARLPILATDCDYEIVSVSGVQGMRL